MPRALGDAFGLPANAPTKLVRVPPPIDILIETGPGSGEYEALDEQVQWTRINRNIDGTPTVANLFAALDISRLSTRHLSDIIDEITPDRRIIIQQSNGEGAPLYLFVGYPQTSTLQWTEDSQAWSCSMRSEPEEVWATDSSRMIVGRQMRRDPNIKEFDQGGVAVVPALPLHFNAGGRPNRSPYFKFDNRETGAEHDLGVFTEDSYHDAEFWTYADALRYLIFFYNSDLEEPDALRVSTVDFWSDTDQIYGGLYNAADRDSLRRLLLRRVPDTRLDGVDLWTAVSELVTAAGLHVHFLTTPSNEGSAQGANWQPRHSLRIFPAAIRNEKPDPLATAMIRPVSRPLPREKPFDAIRAGRTAKDIARAGEAMQSTAIIDHRRINRAAVWGGVKRYECTLLLLPGWLPHPNLDDVEQTQSAIEAAQDFWWEELGDQNSANESKYHRDHKDFGDVADVGRKWVYPTGGDYASEDGVAANSPYYRAGLPTGHNYEPLGPGDVNKLADFRLGGGLADAALERWGAHRRPFRSPFSRIGENVTIPPYLEFKVDGDPFADVDWQAYMGAALRIDLLDSAVWIEVENPVLNVQRFDYADDALVAPAVDDNWFAWLVEQKLYLRITVAIDGDFRINRTENISTGGLLRTRAGVFDMAERYRFQKVAGTNSIFRTNDDPDPEYGDIDDSAEELPDMARAVVGDASRERVSGNPEIPWIEADYQLGDSLTGSPGIGIKFNDPPEVVAIQYLNDPKAGQRTQLVLADLRTNPNLAVEED